MRGISEYSAEIVDGTRMPSAAHLAMAHQTAARRAASRLTVDRP